MPKPPYSTAETCFLAREAAEPVASASWIVAAVVGVVGFVLITSIRAIIGEYAKSAWKKLFSDEVARLKRDALLAQGEIANLQRDLSYAGEKLEELIEENGRLLKRALQAEAILRGEPRL